MDVLRIATYIIMLLLYLLGACIIVMKDGRPILMIAWITVCIAIMSMLYVY